jgi:phosphoglycolate phosphatase-like HAD superfamily hydrolase
MATPTLVLWDIDHMLVETRGLGGELYRVAFEEITRRKMGHKADVTGKTEPTILTETLKAHGLEPSEQYGVTFHPNNNTVIIGDSLSDVETGLKGGAKVIGVASAKSSVEELREAEASIVLLDLTSVTDLTRAVQERGLR